MTDRLFMMRPGFFDGERGPLYCPDCLGVEGLLSFYPELRSRIEIYYVDAPRPRAEIVAFLGLEYQSVPVLVLDPDTAPPAGIVTKRAGSYSFIDDPDLIRSFLSLKYQVGVPA